jgi:cobalamin-dependent methionine synthase I
LACRGAAGRRLAESWPTKQHNNVRHLLLHPTAHDLKDWDTQNRGCVTRLRAYTGTHPDPGYGLIAKLRVAQPELEMLPPDAASIELPHTWPVAAVAGAAGSGVAAA